MGQGVALHPGFTRPQAGASSNYFLFLPDGIELEYLVLVLTAFGVGL